ncbi:ATP-binding protein [Streptomyces sp. NPDC020917]|uniref:ATP-binding protein n=1 Tax=Streptomyces sp. NPDC020917 TaxID=3365102 RepID=UPI00378F1A82
MRPVAAAGGRRPEVRHFHLTLSLERGAVTAARHDVTAALAEFGYTSRTAFSDAVLLVVSELVTNVVQHAADRSPTLDIGVTAGPGELVITVEDQDPRIPDLAPAAVGGGLRVVTELAAEYGGSLVAQPLPLGEGKSMQVRLLPPVGAR